MISHITFGVINGECILAPCWIPALISLWLNLISGCFLSGKNFGELCMAWLAHISAPNYAHLWEVIFLHWVEPCSASRTQCFLEEDGLGWLVPCVFLQREWYPICLLITVYWYSSICLSPLPWRYSLKSLYFLIIFDVYRNAWFYIFTDVRWASPRLQSLPPDLERLLTSQSLHLSPSVHSSCTHWTS